MADPTPATELSWAAGFFDGEGCVSRTGNKSSGIYYLHLQVAQSGSPETLERFNRAIPVGKVYGPYVQKDSRRKPMYGWHATGIEAFTAYDLLAPYLSSIKKNRYHELVDGGQVVDSRAPKMCTRGLHVFEDNWMQWGKYRVCEPCIRKKLGRKKRAKKAT